MALVARKCSISFKTEDAEHRRSLQSLDAFDIVDKSFNEPILSDNEDSYSRRFGPNTSRTRRDDPPCRVPMRMFEMPDKSSNWRAEHAYHG